MTRKEFVRELKILGAFFGISVGMVLTAFILKLDYIPMLVGTALIIALRALIKE